MQLRLREGYYGLPAGHVDYDCAVFERLMPAGKRLIRMTDICDNWRRAKPYTTHRLGGKNRVNYAVSHGLVAAYGEVANHKTVLWNQDSERNHGYYDYWGGPAERPFSWAVWDLYHLRHNFGYLDQNISKWTCNVPHPLSGLDIYRPDNVVATLWKEVIENKGAYALRIKLNFYLLEPTDTVKWEENSSSPARRHPDAFAIEYVEPFSRDNGPHPSPRDVPFEIKLTGNATVLVTPNGFSHARLYNWKTGQLRSVRRSTESLISSVYHFQSKRISSLWWTTH